MSDWSIGVLDEVNKSGLGNVLTIELSNLDLSLVVLLGPVGSLIIDGVVSIVIWEALIEDILEGLATSEGISNMSGSTLCDSLDHHGKGDVGVIGDVLLLISSSLEDGVEGVISNNLSEGLESHGLNNILRVGWVDLEGDGLNLVDWDISGLSESIEWVRLGSNEVSLSWGSLLVVLVVMLLVVGL